MLRIVVDSGSSIKREEAKKYGIDILPINILIDGKEYLDGINIDSETFYNLLATKKFPKTALPNLEDARELVEGYTNNGDDVLIITISSHISGCNNAITVMFSENKHVEVVDSELAVGGIRLLVECALRNKNKPLKEVAEEVRKLIPRVKIMAIPETLDYLMKGGRLSKVEWLVGSVLKIKPVITFKEGKVAVEAKKIGLKNAMSYINQKTQQLGVDETYPIVASYTFSDKNLQTLIDESGIDRKNFVFDDLSFSIASHWGPNAFGFIFVTK
ncbi:MAG: DegV family protein [Clostridia bacterium]|nr:DegV family protein [Clostridia bacterium]